MVVVQNIVLKRLTLISFLQLGKSRLLIKYLLNHKNSFCWSDFAKHLEKPLILQKNHMARPVKFTLRDNSDNLKIIFYFQFSQYFLTLNVTKFNSLGFSKIDAKAYVRRDLHLF